MVTFIPLNCPSPEIMTRLLKIIHRPRWDQFFLPNHTCWTDQRTEGSIPVADVSKNSTTQTQKSLAG